MRHRFELAIPGAQSASSWLTVYAPFDRSAIGEVATADAATVEQALSNAHAAFSNKDRWLSLAVRLQIIERVITTLHANAEFLATESAREGGKPLMDSKVEVARAIDSLKGCIEHMRSDAGEVIPMRSTASSAGRMAFTQREPIGVVMAVSAFNHPLNLIAHQIGPAIAAGCPVIVKPAKATPLSCMRLVQMFIDSGLPPEFCQAIVPVDNQLSTALVTDPRVAFFSFIGSAAVGWKLKSQLAPGTRAALEHGGVAPVVVAQDADLALAVPSLAKGGFYHAGQVCVSVQRVYAEVGIARILAERIASAGARMRVGDPTDADIEVGPLIDPSEVQRIDAWVQQAVNAGAECLTGGAEISATCYPPTVLFNPPDDCLVSQKEVFGPVICVYPVANIDEAIHRANSLRVAFQAAVFTQSIDTALRCHQRLNASAVMVNDHTAFRVDWMPFAGLRESGYGVGGIPHTLREMQVSKMMVIKSAQIL